MNMTLKPASGLSGSTLKVIAMISMVIDHVALYLMEHGTVLYETMRCIGRIAFPVFPDFITFFNFSYKPALQVSVAAFLSLIWVTHGNFVSSCYVCA